MRYLAAALLRQPGSAHAAHSDHAAGPRPEPELIALTRPWPRMRDQGVEWTAADLAMAVPTRSVRATSR